MTPNPNSTAPPPAAGVPRSQSDAKTFHRAYKGTPSLPALSGVHGVTNTVAIVVQ